jgi:hypothetical protein
MTDTTPDKPKEKALNLTVPPDVHTFLSDVAWENRTTMRKLVRSMLWTMINIRIGIKGNERAAQLYRELLAELRVTDGEDFKV